MTEANSDPLGHRIAGEAHEMGSIPQLSVQNATNDLAYPISFTHPFDDPTTEKPPVSQVRGPQFVAVDGEIGGNSHNETNVE